MEHLVVTLETAKKLKAAGFPPEVAFAWYCGTDGWSVDRAGGFIGTCELPVCAPTAQEIADQLPLEIPSKEYLGEQSELWLRKDGEDGKYYAWYFVTGIKDVRSDYGEHAETMAEALALLWLKLQETK